MDELTLKELMEHLEDYTDEEVHEYCKRYKLELSMEGSSDDSRQGRD